VEERGGELGAHPLAERELSDGRIQEGGEIQQLGPEWSLFFRDVDGMELEVCAPAD
jgi:hypothetical protein